MYTCLCISGGDFSIKFSADYIHILPYYIECEKSNMSEFTYKTIGIKYPDDLLLLQEVDL